MTSFKVEKNFSPKNFYGGIPNVNPWKNSNLTTIAIPIIN